MDSLSGARGLSVPGPAVQIYYACANAPATAKTIKPALAQRQKSNPAPFLSAPEMVLASGQKLALVERVLITVSVFTYVFYINIITHCTSNKCFTYALIAYSNSELRIGYLPLSKAKCLRRAFAHLLRNKSTTMYYTVYARSHFN